VAVGVAVAAAVPVGVGVTASPDCGVPGPGSRRIRRAGGCPTIRRGIVFATSVQIIALSAPDDHFTASPHCSVPLTGTRCIDGACS